MKNKSNYVRNIGRVFWLAVLLALAAVVPAFAESITKGFEFGAGTAHTISNKRNFTVPCGTSVSAQVTFSRLGDVGASNDVPIVIELRKPSSNSNTDGQLAASLNVTARRAEQTRTLNGSASNLGCPLQWTVRVKPANGQSPRAILGSITVTFNDSSSGISVEGGLITLDKGTSETKKIGGSGGLKQGKITITADWNHSAFGVPGPLPVKLKFELIDPSGNVVASDSGYSDAEINPCCSDDKMKLTFNVPSCITGQWKLKITNNTNDDTMNIDPTVRFSPDCPN